MRRTAPVLNGDHQLSAAKIDHETYEAFDKLASRHGLSKADLLRFGILHILANPELARMAADAPRPMPLRVVTVKALRDW